MDLHAWITQQVDRKEAGARDALATWNEPVPPRPNVGAQQRHRTQPRGVDVPAFLVIHPREQRRDDLRLSGDDITLRFEAGWAVFADSQGDCLAIPCGQGASIQRDDEPLPEGELADNAPALNK